MSIDHDHFVIFEAETSALSDSIWESWISEVEKLLGQSPDGDQAEDGFSLDAFHELFKSGRTPAQAIQKVGSIVY